MRFRRPWFLALLSAPLLAGCVAEQTHKRPPSPPSQARISLVTITLHAILDEDHNGYPDTLNVIVYLWDDRYPLPLWADGSMTFELRNPADEPIAEWEVPAEVLRATKRRDQVGAAHVLSLDLRQATTDQLPAETGMLTGRFVPSGHGEPATTIEPLAIRIGG
ncbi:MAG: hypothetical protein IPJ41_16000 [Phycisphaerales bacterium]|nr:hypothetical protein [Phycisphaerales bacterium]